ncbi:hypothetical protein BDN71DRAFT_1434143 [Pleurotus eryngii]|uniref:Uncharacterized protein n=1 Tax=Pleurotus eryngii TaxID=5323 RepID=A0A9P5ZNN7_PLEER|nr:hypothetical protein BDN71DRAFT_1434143 [Pleurotus eryngii]
MGPGVVHGLGFFGIGSCKVEGTFEFIEMEWPQTHYQCSGISSIEPMVLDIDSSRALQIQDNLGVQHILAISTFILADSSHIQGSAPDFGQFNFQRHTTEEQHTGLQGVTAGFRFRFRLGCIIIVFHHFVAGSGIRITLGYTEFFCRSICTLSCLLILPAILETVTSLATREASAFSHELLAFKQQ